MRDGTRIYRKIIGAAIVGSEGVYENIVLDEEPGVELTLTNVLRISFISFCRLDQDTIELVHHVDSKGLTTANLMWRTDPGIAGVFSETTIEIDSNEPVDLSLPRVYDPFKVPAGKLWMYTPSFATFSGSDYVGVLWASRRPAEDVIAQNPTLPDTIDDAFPLGSVSGGGDVITLPLTGSFIVRVGSYIDPMGWTPPTTVYLQVQFIDSPIEDIEIVFAAGIIPGDPLNSAVRYKFETGRLPIALDDPEIPMKVHLNFKFIGGVNAKFTCNPAADCTPYTDDTGGANNGDSYWIIEWFP
jgi:hypothetical protein